VDAGGGTSTLKCKVWLARLERRGLDTPVRFRGVSRETPEDREGSPRCPAVRLLEEATGG